MKEYISRNFNVQRLLTLGELDIRGVAAKNKSLTAKEYFAAVERFLENTSNYTDIAARAGSSDSPDGELKELKELKEVLKKIGYDGLSDEIDGVCDAFSSGKQALGEKWLLEITENIRSLYDKIKSAHVSRRFKSQSDDDSKAPDEKVLLSEALEYFDYQEAHRKLRILAVDDVAVVLNTITSVLSPYYEVFALTKASQVESFLTHTTPELFLLDIEMPELSGYDLVSVIRNSKGHADTPIIFLTGNATLENIKTAVSVGACDFITKPVNRDILLEKIESKIVWKKAF